LGRISDVRRGRGFRLLVCDALSLDMRICTCPELDAWGLPKQDLGPLLSAPLLSEESSCSQAVWSGEHILSRRFGDTDIFLTNTNRLFIDGWVDLLQNKLINTVVLDSPTSGATPFDVRVGSSSTVASNTLCASGSTSLSVTSCSGYFGRCVSIHFPGTSRMALVANIRIFLSGGLCVWSQRRGNSD